MRFRGDAERLIGCLSLARIGVKPRRRMFSLRQGLKFASIGLAGGLLLASGLTRLLTGFLFGVHPFDPIVFKTVSLLLGGIAVLACWLDALHANPDKRGGSQYAG